MVVSASAAPRVALLVGVSNYPKPVDKDQNGRDKRGWTQLHTHDELEALRKVLIERHGFQKKDIMVLEDFRVTGKAIRDAFTKHLIEQAKPGGAVFFHFSGHG